jgi:hypothetical protein
MDTKIYNCKCHGTPYTVCPICHHQYCPDVWVSCPRASWHVANADSRESGYRPDITLTLAGLSLMPTWVTIQSLVRESLNTEGRLTRIVRPDGGCNYRATGVYHATFTPSTGDNRLIRIVL